MQQKDADASSFTPKSKTTWVSVGKEAERPVGSAPREMAQPGSSRGTGTWEEGADWGPPVAKQYLQYFFSMNLDRSCRIFWLCRATNCCRQIWSREQW